MAELEWIHEIQYRRNSQSDMWIRDERIPEEGIANAKAYCAASNADLGWQKYRVERVLWFKEANR